MDEAGGQTRSHPVNHRVDKLVELHGRTNAARSADG